MDTRYARTTDGWLLSVARTFDPARLDRRAPPLLIVPGYGMNGFIFGYHPRGTSMNRALAEAGFEVWTMDLRAHGRARPVAPNAAPPSLARYALRDLPAALDVVLAATHTDANRVVLVGVSLGGAISYGYLAHHGASRVAGVVAMGAPLRWDRPHRLIRLAFASPELVGLVPVRGTRIMARLALPVLARIPFVLRPYVNAKHVDVSKAHELVATVEDPHPAVNADLARWMRAHDLVLEGRNVTEALANVDVPLLVVIAGDDGIVPEPVSLSVLDAWGGTDVKVLRVGDANHEYAHADLFIADRAHEDVFLPVARWIASLSEPKTNLAEITS